MDPDDRLLLGTDLVKDPARIVAAYDDAAGVTAAFNKNVLRVLNHQLAATSTSSASITSPVEHRRRVDRDAPAVRPATNGSGSRRSISRSTSPPARSC